MVLLNQIKNLSKNETEVIVAKNNKSFGGNGKPGLITVTYHGKCGRRISLSRKVYKDLGNPKDIKVSFNGAFLVLRDGCGYGYQLSKRDTGKPILYNAGVTKAIVDRFEIDLSTHTTHTFYNGELVDDAFYIEMLSEGESETATESEVVEETENLTEENFFVEEAEGETDAESTEDEPNLREEELEEEEMLFDED